MHKKKKNNQKHTLAKVPNIKCLRNQKARVHFEILQLEENLNTFHIKQAESEPPPVAEQTYFEIFPVSDVPKTFTGDFIISEFRINS